MRTKKNLLAVAAALIVCGGAIWFSTSIQGGERTYEIHPEVAVPYGYTPTIDTHRLIDLIERLTAQNQQAIQERLSKLNKNLKGAVKKLDAIHTGLAELSERIARIEKALGIEQPPPPTEKNAGSEATYGKPKKKSLPSM
jgi:ABC-type transporter Mla subunit MlaD